MYRCLGWILLLFLLEAVIYITGFHFPSYNGKEVFTAIRNSKEKSSKRVLILGDSVGNQLYPSDREYPDVISLACNQAISLAGQFFLMDNYFKTNEDSLPSRVVLILSPLSLQNDLDRFAFHYFLKPFYKKEYKPLFDELLWERVKKIPHYRLSRLPFVRISNFSFAYDLEPEPGYEWISPVSRAYLGKMQLLASSRNMDFSLLCAPARQSRETEFVSIMERGRQELDSTLLSSFLGSARYYPDSLFVDEIHFVKEEIPEDLFGLILSE